MYRQLRNFTEIEDVPLVMDKYLADDLPAMKKESYTYNNDQYKAAVYYDIKSVPLPGRMVEEFNTTWKHVRPMSMPSVRWEPSGVMWSVPSRKS